MFQMLAKAYVKAERNMHFLITRPGLEIGFTSLTPWTGGHCFPGTLTT